MVSVDFTLATTTAGVDGGVDGTPGLAPADEGIDGTIGPAPAPADEGIDGTTGAAPAPAGEGIDGTTGPAPGPAGGALESIPSNKCNLDMRSNIIARPKNRAIQNNK